MATLSIRPVSRFATPGSRVRFAVRLEGAEGGEVAQLAVRPCAEAAGYRASLASGQGEAPVGAGGQAGADETMTVEVPARAGMA